MDKEKDKAPPLLLSGTWRQQYSNCFDFYQSLSHSPIVSRTTHTVASAWSKQASLSIFFFDFSKTLEEKSNQHLWILGYFRKEILSIITGSFIFIFSIFRWLNWLRKKWWPCLESFIHGVVSTSWIRFLKISLIDRLSKLTDPGNYRNLIFNWLGFI